MITNVPTEVIPVWFIEKWLRNNAKAGSALDFWVKKMLKEWKLYETRNKSDAVEQWSRRAE